ncbi:MAG: hypothetical protein HC933_06385 [Pleurocapsa sp. SU_196_0]|nr:hypothetical protein [Pleurocapsa sp. SU_196_0]
MNLDTLGLTLLSLETRSRADKRGQAHGTLATGLYLRTTLRNSGLLSLKISRENAKPGTREIRKVQLAAQKYLGFPEQTPVWHGDTAYLTNREEQTP